MVLKGAGTMAVDVNNNMIDGNATNQFDFGIRGGARAGTGTADFQINNNSVPSAEVAGVWFFAGNATGGETSRTCVNFVNNRSTATSGAALHRLLRRDVSRARCSGSRASRDRAPNASTSGTSSPAPTMIRRQPTPSSTPAAAPRSTTRTPCAQRRARDAAGRCSASLRHSWMMAARVAAIELRSTTIVFFGGRRDAWPNRSCPRSGS